MFDKLTFLELNSGLFLAGSPTHFNMANTIASEEIKDQMHDSKLRKC
jgi:hypothetical protein